MLEPSGILFAPLEVLYSTRFGSKHHIMVQLAHFNKVDITDPFPDLWSPPRGAHKATISANKAPLRRQIVLNLAFWPLKSSSDGPKPPYLVQNAPSGWPPQVKCNCNPIVCSIYGILGLYRVLKGLYLLI